MGLISEPYQPFPFATGRTMESSDPSTDPVPPRSCRPSDVLLVEDNFIIALDTEDMLRQLGVETVRTARSVTRALELIDAGAPDFALLDVNLGDEKCFEIAERLRDLGVPFAFATGYGDNHALPAKFADAPIVPKPYNSDDIEKVLAAL
jgi:CheY-like chemotaxis protein